MAGGHFLISILMHIRRSRYFVLYIYLIYLNVIIDAYMYIKDDFREYYLVLFSIFFLFYFFTDIKSNV